MKRVMKMPVGIVWAMALMMGMTLGSFTWASAQSNPWDVRNIYANDGSFLGNTNQNTLDLNSIYNPLGRYGSQVSRDSIDNTTGRYGSSVSPLSSNNPAAQSGYTAPRSVLHTRPVWVGPYGGRGQSAPRPLYIRRGW